MFGVTNTRCLYMLSSPILWRLLGMVSFLATMLFLAQALATDYSTVCLVYVIYTCCYSTSAIALFLSCSLCPVLVHVLELSYLVFLRNSRLLRKSLSLVLA